MTGRVELLGRVAEDELPWLYAAADLAVVPTRALEGFGLPVLEAWACGVPVVGTAVGALAETVGQLDPGLVAAAPGAEPLAEALARALASPEPVAARAERARALALSYAWEALIPRLAAVYRSLDEEAA